MIGFSCMISLIQVLPIPENTKIIFLSGRRPPNKKVTPLRSLYLCGEISILGKGALSSRESPTPFAPNLPHRFVIGNELYLEEEVGVQGRVSLSSNIMRNDDEDVNI